MLTSGQPRPAVQTECGGGDRVGSDPGQAGESLTQLQLQVRPDQEYATPATLLSRPWPGSVKDSQCDTQCVICLSDFRSGVEVRRLACLHLFHARCVDAWLLNNRQECYSVVTRSDLSSLDCVPSAEWMWRPPLLSSARTGRP